MVGSGQGSVASGQSEQKVSCRGESSIEWAGLGNNAKWVGEPGPGRVENRDPMRRGPSAYVDVA
jgi:hypothetical protein